MTAQRPWETVVAPTWAAAQSLYDRVVAVHRAKPPTTVGPIAYQGVLVTAETVRFTGIPASIQYQLRRDPPRPNLPADAFSVPLWHIWLPAGFITPGQIAERDIVIDDLARRFQLFGAWPNALGYMLAGELLET